MPCRRNGWLSFPRSFHLSHQYIQPVWIYCRIPCSAGLLCVSPKAGSEFLCRFCRSM